MTQNNQTRFVHLSDAHIGHRQYGVKKRRDDMYMSFRTTLLDALEDDVDFAVFSGDLFHNKDVNARALSDAEKGLDTFAKEDTPVVAIQGNHDAKLYKEDLNWLEYLHARERLVLLEADLTGDGPVFEKHDFENPGTSSGYVDIDGVRVFGLQYLGQRTETNLEDVAEAIQAVHNENGEPEFTVLLGHFGIEGHIPGMGGGISFSSLEPLEDVVDYLGLGHLHKQYSHGDWVFNPGSLEAHSIREAKWDHGYYVVDVTEEDVDTEFQESKRRPFYHIEFAVDQYDAPDELVQGFVEAVEEELSDLRRVQEQDRHLSGDSLREPVIDLHLSGLLQFSRSQLEIDEIRDIAEEKTGAVYVNLTDGTESKETATILQELEEGEEDVRTEDGQLDHDKLEFAVLRRLAGQDARYQEKQDEVAETAAAVKQSVLAADTPETVAETIKNRRRELFPDQGGDD